MSEQPERTALYRIRDEADALIYIGITNSLPHRWNGHMRVQPWWDELRSLTVEWYEKRADAEAAEKAAIETERPKYNKTYLIPRKSLIREVPAPAPLPPSDYASVDDWADDDGLIALADMAEYMRTTPAAMERLTERGEDPPSFCGTGEDLMYRAVDLKIWQAGNQRNCTRDPVSNNPVTGPCLAAGLLEPAVRALGYDRTEFDPETPAGRDEIWDAYMTCLRWLDDHSAPGVAA